MNNRTNNKLDGVQLYFAKISTGWAILKKGKVINFFDSEQELLNFWDDNALAIEGEYYVLEIKNPPFPKIGEIFFELKNYEYLKKENFIIKTDKNRINLITKSGNTIAVFESQIELEKWQLKYIEWKNKVKKKPKKRGRIKGPGYISSVKIEASKENSARKNFTSTDEYKNMQDDSDWWREQS